jgi:hypothetical protein
MDGITSSSGRERSWALAIRWFLLATIPGRYSGFALNELDMLGALNELKIMAISSAQFSVLRSRHFVPCAGIAGHGKL